MPLILLCGHPCSGKTYRAKQIASFLENKFINPNEGASVNGSAQSIQANVKELSELNLKESSSAANGAAPADHVPQTSSTTQPSVTKPVIQSKTTQPQRKIHYISDHTLGIPRSSYLTAKHEKDARGALYSAVKRALSRNDIVILDSGNYIKGWRYQLYCEAKNIGTSSCVVHVGVPADTCTKLNAARLTKPQPPLSATSDDNNPPEDDQAKHETPTLNGSAEQDPYSETAHAELLMRFEEPNPMTRWDTPLYTVPWDDATPPLEQIWTEIILGVGKDGKTKVIRPNQATVLTPASSPSHLYDLERTTQGIISAIQAHQKERGEVVDGDEVVIPVQGEGGAGGRQQLTLELPSSPLTFAHLQRLRRQFIALHRQQMGGMGMGGVGGGHGASGMALSPKRVAELFVEFLGERFSE